MTKLYCLFIIIVMSIMCQGSIDSKINYHRWRLVRIMSSESTKITDELRRTIEMNPNLRLVEERKDQFDIAISPLVTDQDFALLVNKFHFGPQILLHPDIGRLLDMNEGRRSKRSHYDGEHFDKYMPLDEMEAYFSYLEALYPRKIKKEIVGTSYEGRNIYMLSITTNSSILDCQAIRAKQEKDLVDFNRLGNTRKINPFGRRASLVGNNHRIKEIHSSILRRAQTGPNNTHNFIYIDQRFLNKQVNFSQKKVEKPVIFLDGGTHAREWITPAATLYLVNHLVEHPKLTDNIEWKIIPMANPDGYDFSWESDRFWRKTRSVTTFPGCLGADINRNFGHHWGEVDTSNFPCFEHYGGSHAFSEGETAAIRDALYKDQNRIKAYISVHNWGQDIAYPYSYDLNKTPFSNEELKRVSEGMVRSIANNQNTVYKSGSSSTLIYPASGTALDWVYDTLQVPLAYLLELRDDDGVLGFSLPESLIKPTSEDLVSAMTYLASAVELNVTQACDL